MGKKDKRRKRLKDASSTSDFSLLPARQKKKPPSKRRSSDKWTQEDAYTSHTQDQLCVNEFNAYYPSTPISGHVLITFDEQGKLVAKQFLAPGSDNPDNEIAFLENIRLHEHDGSLKATATAHGVEMIAQSSIMVETNIGTPYAQKHQLFFFSQRIMHEGEEVVWLPNQGNMPSLFKEDADPDLIETVTEEVKATRNRKRGGTVDLVPLDIANRSSKRNKSQKRVMHGSAFEAYAAADDEYGEILSDEMRTILEKPFLDNNSSSSQYQAQWCHAIGHGLAPDSFNSQVRTNLGAGPKWFNISMLTIERTARWFALNLANVLQSYQVFFDMLLDTDLIKKASMTLTLSEGERSVTLKKELTPWVDEPYFARAKDTAQTVLVAYHLLKKTRPVTREIQMDESVVSDIGILAYQPVYEDQAGSAEAARLVEPSLSEEMPVEERSISPVGFSSAFARLPSQMAALTLEATNDDEEAQRARAAHG